MRTWIRNIILLLALIPGISLAAQTTGLLIIDIQEFYFPGGKAQLVEPEAAGMNAGLVLNRFREEGLPVYHVRHNFEPGGKIHEYVKPAAGEPVFSKDDVNAFLGTGLLEQLRKDSVEQLVICGMQTHMCVEAAVRAAHDYGFKCILVSDACATRAQQYRDLIIPAEHVHYSTICTLEGTYAAVSKTSDLLRDFDKWIKNED
jgi:nicotinamidase-related amidase